MSSSTRQITFIERSALKLSEFMIGTFFIVFMIGIATMFYYNIVPGSERELTKFLANFGYESRKFDPTMFSIKYLIVGAILHFGTMSFINILDFITGKKSTY